MKTSSDRNAGGAAPHTLKVLIAGGFGVGKTTLVGTVSEIPPLRTEERLTQAGASVDDLAGIEDKGATTVAMDFGRITLPSVDAVLMMFGTPGQERFWFMWRDLLQGAAGAIVLVDTRHLERSFAAVDFFEMRGLPYIVAANCFDGRQQYGAADIAAALKLDGPNSPPVIMVDARKSESVRDTLLTLLDRLIAQAQPVGT